MHLSPNIIYTDPPIYHISSNFYIPSCIRNTTFKINIINIKNDRFWEIFHGPLIRLISIIIRHYSTICLINRFIDNIPHHNSILIARCQFLNMFFKIKFHLFAVWRHPVRMSPTAHTINNSMAFCHYLVRFAKLKDRIDGRTTENIRRSHRITWLSLLRFQRFPIKRQGRRIKQSTKSIFILFILLHSLKLTEQKDITSKNKRMAQLLNLHSDSGGNI